MNDAINHDDEDLLLPVKTILGDFSDALLKEITLQSSDILLINLTDELQAETLDLFSVEDDEAPVELRRYAFRVKEEIFSAGELINCRVIQLNKAERTLDAQSSYLLFLNAIMPGSRLSQLFEVMGICKATSARVAQVKASIQN